MQKKICFSIIACFLLQPLIAQKKTLPIIDRKRNQQLMFEFKNALLSYKQDYISNMKGGYDNLLKYQQELITLITKEYHLE